MIMLIYPTVNALKMHSPTDGSDVKAVTDTRILSSLSQGKVENVRQNISEANQEADYTEQKKPDPEKPDQDQHKDDQQTQPPSHTEEILSKLDNGELSYRNVFKNVCIVGDSLMNGLETYNILNSNNLITQVSASLYHLNDNIDKIVRMNPEIVILHYGLNHLDTGSHQPAKFIKFYTEIITELKEKLPATRIIVSGIFPVDTDKARASRFGRIDNYNKAIEDMCSQLSVEFLDNSIAFADAKEYYASDGIHLSKDFYENCWLRSIVAEKEIYK